MKCFQPMCTVSPKTGGALYRVNAKGQPGVWACIEHVRSTDAKVDPFVREICELLEGNAHPTKGNADG